MTYLVDQSTADLLALVSALRPGQCRAFYHHRSSQSALVEYRRSADRVYRVSTTDGLSGPLSATTAADWLRVSGFTTADPDTVVLA